MSAQDHQLVPLLGIPDLEVAFPVTRNDELAVRAEGEAGHVVFVALFDFPQLLASTGIPQLEGVVPAA